MRTTEIISGPRAVVIKLYIECARGILMIDINAAEALVETEMIAQVEIVHLDTAIETIVTEDQDSEEATAGMIEIIDMRIIETMKIDREDDLLAGMIEAIDMEMVENMRTDREDDPATGMIETIVMGTTEMTRTDRKGNSIEEMIGTIDTETIVVSSQTVTTRADNRVMEEETGGILLEEIMAEEQVTRGVDTCLLYTSPSPRDRTRSRMPSSA